MPDLWLPGATVVNRAGMGLGMLGGPSVAVWHTTETDTGTGNAVARGANMAKWPAHLVYEPTSGEVWQLLPANVGASALVTGNREGKTVIQIEVVGRASAAPLASSPMVGLDRILGWLDSWAIPRTWPAGAPPAYGPGGAPAYGRNNGARGLWGRSGHFGHSQVPGNDHGDPGAVNLARWAAPAASAPVFDEPPLGYLLWEGARDLVQGRYTFVRWVQSRLSAHGLRITVDGDFGRATSEAVKTFQASRRLTPDGVFGPMTHNALKG